MDDEHFRTMVALRHDLDGPDAEFARESALRSLHRSEARGQLTSLLAGVRHVDLTTPAGLYLGRGQTYSVDTERLSRVVRRATLGLVYHEIGVRVPSGYEVRAYLPSAIDPTATEAIGRIRAIADALLTRPVKFVGRRVFAYRWGAAAEDPYATAWLLTFYERVVFLAITAPPRITP